jgi:hypothetical protein
MHPIARTLSAFTLASMASVHIATFCLAQPPVEQPSVVRQVDHALIASSDASALFSLFTDTFQLPVAWPMSDYSGFASGGVAVGNVNLEIIQHSQSTANAPASLWTGIALEPAPLTASLPELAARKIQHGTPAPFRSLKWNGWKTLWTTVALPDVSNDATQVFLCEYDDELPIRRRSRLEELRSLGGGPLSVRSTREIIIGAKDAKQTQSQWQKLLNPLQPPSDGAWQLPAGPAMRIVQSNEDGIRGMVISVKSLTQARTFLQEHRLLGTDQPAELTLSGPLLKELNVTLVEAAP